MARAQRNMFFAMIKPSALARIIEPSLEAEESIYRMCTDDAVSTVTTVQMHDEGVRRFDGDSAEALLLLDLRELDDFEASHIHGARHYDRRQLSKATNQFPKEIYYYKGPATSKKLVVLYDEDGKGLTEVANGFVEKGIENTYVLSGGFQAVRSRYPHIIASMSGASAAAAVGPSASVAAALAGRGGGPAGGVPPSPCRTAMSRLTQDTNLLSMGGIGSTQSQHAPWK